MKYIDLFEKFVIKQLTDEDGSGKDIEFAPIGGREIRNGQKSIRKQDIIIAADDTIKDIVWYEIEKLGKDADLNHINVSKVTNMEELFYETDFSGDISQWDVSNVNEMGRMFTGCKKFNSDLSKWDVSNVTNMVVMFYGCKEFNSDLSKWNVSNVTNMSHMLTDCEKFNSDLSNWNVSNVTDMTYMFGGCKQFNSDLSKWNVSNVTHMDAMFYECEKFNSDLSNWNIKNYINIKDVFRDCPIKDEYKPKIIYK